MSMIKKGMKAGEPEVLSGEKEVNEFWLALNSCWTRS